MQDLHAGYCLACYHLLVLTSHLHAEVTALRDESSHSTMTQQVVLGHPLKQQDLFMCNSYLEGLPGGLGRGTDMAPQGRASIWTIYER